MNTIDKKISILKILLKKLCQVDLDEEWDEAWHEEAVKEFGDEIEEESSENNFYFKEEEIKPSDKKILDKYNIELIELDSKRNRSSILGSGEQGIVYNAIYKGHPVAVKISYAKSDVFIWSKILDLKEKLPDEMKKHLPKIYDLFIDTEYVHNRYIVIMERLLPLPRQVAKYFNHGRADNKGIKPKINLNKLYTKDLFLEYLKNDEFIDITVPSLEQLEKIEISEEDLNDSILVYPYEDDINESIILYYKIIKFLKNTNQLNGKDLRELKLTIIEYTEFLERLAKHEDSKQNYLYGFPGTGFISDPKFIDYLPEEFHSFFNFLMELKKYGIIWHDVHSENIMIGQEDREIKLVDVGLF